MLWTYAHHFPSIVHSAEYINTEEVSLTIRLIQQTCEYRYCSRLACTIVAEQAKDLIRIHLHIETVNGFESIFILFVEVGDFQVLLVNFLLIYIRS